MFTLRERVDEESQYLRRATLLDADGDYELTVIPDYFAQAVGVCLDVEFYFRAKHGEWEFETQNHTGHPFDPTDSRAFRRTGACKSINIEWATRCLQQCLAELCWPSTES